MNIVVDEQYFPKLFKRIYPDCKVYEGKSGGMSLARSIVATEVVPTVFIKNALTNDEGKYEEEYGTCLTCLQQVAGDLGCVVLAKPRLEIMFFQVGSNHRERCGLNLNKLELELAEYAPLMVLARYQKDIPKFIENLDDDFIKALKKTKIFKEIDTFFKTHK